MTDLSICILTWNTRDLTVACIDSILAHTRRIRYEIILVDNGSRDGTESVIRERFPTVRFIRNEENLGFTRGNNQAMRLAQGRYVMILNNDTEIDDGCLDMMIERMDAEPEAGIACCKMVYPDRTLYYNIHESYPDWTNILAERSIITELWHGGRLHRHFRSKYDVIDERKYGEDRTITWGLGAFLVARRNVIDKIGLLDERFFIYFEEIDWCKRCAEAGFLVKYYHEPVVVHHTAKSIVQEYSRMTDVWHTSRLAYFAKHHGAFPMLVLKLSTASGILVRLFKYRSQIRRARAGGDSAQADKLEEMRAAYRNILKKVMTYESG